MPIDPLVAGFLLYLTAKSMERRMPFYGAAALYAVLYPLTIQLIGVAAQQLAASEGVSLSWSILGQMAVYFVVGLPVFYLLDKYEDTIVNWAVTFAVGFVIFAFVL